MVNGEIGNWLRVDDAPGGQVMLRHVEIHSGRSGLFDTRSCGVAETDLARLFHALTAAAQKWPQRGADVLAEAPEMRERVIVERPTERVAIARGADGRFVLNVQRLVRCDGDGEMHTGVSITLDPRDLVAVARAMIESLDPVLTMLRREAAGP